MWTHKKLKGQFIGNYEYAKNGIRVLFLEKFNDAGKKIASYKFKSWQHAKAQNWECA